MYSDNESVLKESGTHSRQVEVIIPRSAILLIWNKAVLFESSFQVQYLRDASPLLLQQDYGTDKIRIQ